MANVKITISLPEPLSRRAETVAHELQISRSQLAATAIDEFVKYVDGFDLGKPRHFRR
jgi:predicted transcriptional regulator